MNSLSITDKSRDSVRLALAARSLEQQADDQKVEERWFDAPPSSQSRSSAPPPVVHVGEFLGDPEVDAWLR